jgi:hypothetical protein
VNHGDRIGCNAIQHEDGVSRIPTVDSDAKRSNSPACYR